MAVTIKMYSPHTRPGTWCISYRILTKPPRRWHPHLEMSSLRLGAQIIRSRSQSDRRVKIGSRPVRICLCSSEPDAQAETETRDKAEACCPGLTRAGGAAHSSYCQQRHSRPGGPLQRKASMPPKISHYLMESPLGGIPKLITCILKMPALPPGNPLPATCLPANSWNSE